MSNDAKDRHVLALAVYVDATVIVTFNVKHFPAEACAPLDIEVEHPDTFVTRLVVVGAITVLTAIEEMAGRRARPPASTDEIMAHLTRSLPLAMQELRLRTTAP